MLLLPVARKPGYSTKVATQHPYNKDAQKQTVDTISIEKSHGCKFRTSEDLKCNGYPIEASSGVFVENADSWVLDMLWLDWSD